MRSSLYCPAMSKKAAQLLVERLIQWRVDTIFALPGDGINGIYEALRVYQDQIRVVQVRHEEAATHVTLLLESLGEVRVVSCLQSEWDRAEPDLGDLLARALPAGASRGVGGGVEPERAEDL